MGWQARVEEQRLAGVRTLLVWTGTRYADPRPVEFYQRLFDDYVGAEPARGNQLLASANEPNEPLHRQALGRAQWLRLGR